MVSGYGDYFQVWLDKYRGPNLVWTGKICYDVAILLEDEEKSLAAWHNAKPRPIEKPKTPMSDSSTKSC